jgi:ribose 5-phosphate isomerase B
MEKEKILIAADPFAIGLKDAVAAHLAARGFDVQDMGACAEAPEKPYYDSAVDVCRALQSGQAARAVLLCGTGMGMSMIANRFAGVRAAVVESVYAAKMCRAINDANVLCLGQMVWGAHMAQAAVDAFVDTAFTETLEPLAAFLEAAREKVAAIRD